MNNKGAFQKCFKTVNSYPLTTEVIPETMYHDIQETVGFGPCPIFLA